MDDLLSSIRKLQELYDDPDIITTADRIKIPEPKQEVKNIELVNDFMKRNPRADGGRIGYSIGDRVNPITPQNNLMDMTLEESTTGPGGYPMTAGLTTAMKVPSAIKAIESGAKVLWDVGIAPGFSNMLITYASRFGGGISNAEI